MSMTEATSNDDKIETRVLDVSEEQLDVIYTALSKSTEWWVVINRGPFAWRFGPYEAKEVGEIMTKAVEEELYVSIVGNCGREFDWQLARDLGMRMKLRSKKDGRQNRR